MKFLRVRTGIGLVLFLVAFGASGCLPVTLPPESSGITRVTPGHTPTPGPLAPLKALTSSNAFEVQLLATLDMPTYTKGEDAQCNVALSPDGLHILGACGTGSVPVWDLQTGELLFSLATSEQVTACAYSPSGEIIACGGFAGNISLSDALTGTRIGEITGVVPPIWDIAFSPDKKTLATCGKEDMVRLWDLTTAMEVWSSQATSHCLGIDFDPTGSMLAYGTEGGTAGLINANSGEVTQELLTAGKPVGDIRFDGSGMLLAAGSSDDLVYLWRTADYSRYVTLRGHYHQVNGVAFNPGGSLLISTSHDGSLHIRSVATGDTLKIVGGRGDVLLRGTFSPDGRIIAAIGASGRVYLFGVAGSTVLPDKES